MKEHDARIDAALFRGLTQPRLTRRQLLRYAGVGAGSVGLASLLAACGTKGVTGGTSQTNGSPQANAPGSPEWWGKQTLNHEFSFANWAYYIDTSHGKHPTLDQFTSATGITVDYREAVNDNVAFFAKIRPDLEHGNYTGYDLIVSTDNDPPLEEMIRLGWAIPLDQSRMPNFYQYSSKLVQSPPFDPGNKYTMAWQAGYTLLAYNSKFVKEPITSVQALFDPKYEGHIGMLGIASELGCLGLLAIGKDPATSTPDDWKAAADKLQKQRPLVRSYYDASYIRALKNEETWISMAWSGDIFQAATYQGYQWLKSVVPQEGAMFWTDYMLIPYTAKSPLDAMTYMDSVYDPHVQALIEDYVAYVCPVPAAQEIIRTELKDPKVANSPTVFPTPEMESLSRHFPQWSSSEVINTWNDTFVPIFQGS
ncbi:MAG: spermidine/putrescine ABC transporter substrate-binding protein [Actinobacteria bacterium]|nr:spermidine/putrescine ABC transporter substrate-binding protein [Actinomycetota bacterium]